MYREASSTVSNRAIKYLLISIMDVQESHSVLT